WQRAQYPKRYRDHITVVHEGVDTSLVRPDPTARLWLSSGRCLSRADEIVTYSARDLEPYRGFHVFMGSLPRVIARRPAAEVAQRRGRLGSNVTTSIRSPCRPIWTCCVHCCERARATSSSTTIGTIEGVRWRRSA